MSVYVRDIIIKLLQKHAIFLIFKSLLDLFLEKNLY